MPVATRAPAPRARGADDGPASWSTAGPPIHDVLRVWTRCAEVKGARFRYEYVLESDGEIVASGSTMHATVDRKTHRPVRVPAWFVDAVARAEGWASAPARVLTAPQPAADPLGSGSPAGADWPAGAGTPSTFAGFAGGGFSGADPRTMVGSPTYVEATSAATGFRHGRTPCAARSSGADAAQLLDDPRALDQGRSRRTRNGILPITCNGAVSAATRRPGDRPSSFTVNAPSPTNARTRSHALCR